MTFFDRAPLSLLTALSVAFGALACSSAPKSVPTGDSGTSVEQGPPPVFDAAPTGWAAVPDLDLSTTTGGDGGPVVTVSTSADFKAQAEPDGPRIVLVDGVFGEGARFKVGSNVTVIGLSGAELQGGLRVSGASNVIVRNLKIVGNNCSDSPDDCSGGADAVSIGDGAHHVWFDHCDISDGSDGNLDVNDGADYVTISWTKFWYSGQRPGGHQFSNLVGSSDNSPEDIGHLRVSYHHNWWADHIDERMPRVRYGQVHIFNSLYTAAGNSYCVGVGYFANILTEANVFFGVRDPIESSSYANEQSIVVSRNNLYVESSGHKEDRGMDVFSPPYAYALDDVRTLRARVEGGAGVCASRFQFDAEPPSCSEQASDPAAMTP
jgi:pectate lyase